MLCIAPGAFIRKNIVSAIYFGMYAKPFAKKEVLLKALFFHDKAFDHKKKKNLSVQNPDVAFVKGANERNEFLEKINKQ